VLNASGWLAGQVDEQIEQTHATQAETGHEDRVDKRQRVPLDPVSFLDAHSLDKLRFRQIRRLELTATFNRVEFIPFTVSTYFIKLVPSQDPNETPVNEGVARSRRRNANRQSFRVLARD